MNARKTMRIRRIIAVIAFIAAVFIIGFCAGLCVKVFLVRDVPVIHGGGELLLLLAIPISVATGYITGTKKKKRKGLPNESTEHTYL